jgi:hypothetical protein
MASGGGENTPTTSEFSLSGLRRLERNLARLVFRDEGVAVGDLDQPPVWEQLSQSPTMLRKYDAVLLRPDDERRTVEGARARSRDEHVPLVEGAHGPRAISAH